MTFSKHEKHEKSMAGAANLRLEGVQKSVKIESKKTKKHENADTQKTAKLTAPGPFGDRKWEAGPGGITHFFDTFPTPGATMAPRPLPREPHAPQPYIFSGFSSIWVRFFTDVCSI